ncbi:hypothetical protein ACRALDRAFT_2060715 [Sodiomyces alcalophilus JCM 7366]|uniref:uncharacterized protein n=1 Tax=Sodiomyces alcalophilus JCM 7366 TaxID=591952 RepID=UPI0039B4F6E4
MTPPSTNKRKSLDAPISGPPIKRRAASGTTKSAVANFFTPTSQKPKERTIWTERAPNDDTPATLLVGRYEPENSSEEPMTARRKIAAFDLDSTLITTSSGKKHATEATDWKWWHSSVPGRLRELYKNEGYRVIILSNQGGIVLHPDPKTKTPKAMSKDRVTAFKQKCNAILNHLDIPVSVYAATGRDLYRKPRLGMWDEACDDYDITGDVDLAQSFFVGDAGGRTAVLKNGENGAVAAAKDFSCSDRNFAHNAGIPFKTPEEFFLDEPPRDFQREFDLADYPWPEEAQATDAVFEKRNDKDIVVFVGPPGAGKSTFFWKHLEPLGYERVNQDTLKSRGKCISAAKEIIEDGRSAAIDNTNADPETRAIWVDLAKQLDVPIRCVWFKTALAVCEHNDTVRALSKTMNPESRTALPRIAFAGFKSRFKEPKIKEGFQDITEVEFKFRGSKEEHAIWAKYWL